MNIYRCTVCDYIYQNKSVWGTNDRGVSFEDLPGDWKCPECGSGKTSFLRSVSKEENEKKE